MVVRQVLLHPHPQLKFQRSVLSLACNQGMVQPPPLVNHPLALNHHNSQHHNPPNLHLDIHKWLNNTPLNKCNKSLDILHFQTNNFNNNSNNNSNLKITPLTLTPHLRPPFSKQAVISKRVAINRRVGSNKQAECLWGCSLWPLVALCLY